MSVMEVDHVTVRLDPEPNRPYEDLMVLQKSDRWRSMDEGNVLESASSAIEVDSRYLVALLRRQIQEFVHAPGPVAARRTVLGVLAHGVPMTFLEIASLTSDDVPEVRRDLNVLMQLGIVEVGSNTKGEPLYQVGKPSESTTSRADNHLIAETALRHL